MNQNRRKLSDDGALEGLPLYLIILVVIAGVGTAIIVGWMMNAQSTELGSIEVADEDKIISTGSGQTIRITAYDQDGNELEGATVTIEGCNVQKSGQTNGDGVAELTQVSPELPSNQNFGEIDVTVKYTGDITTTKKAVITVES